MTNIEANSTVPHTGVPAASRDMRLLAAIGVLLVLVVAGLVAHSAQQATDLVQRTTLGNASMYSDALTEFRTLYTTEVVRRVASSEVRVTHDYHDDADAIPLPATLSMELGKRIGSRHDGAITRLYSDHPFPWRSDGGPRDTFEQNALEALRRNASEPFYRFEDFNGRRSLRYATADLMRASCVACHNTHPDSPKRDWKEGDVRGVLEVVLPLDSAIAHSNYNLAKTLGLLVMLGAMGLSGLTLVFRSQRRSTRQTEAANAHLAEANQELEEKSTRLRLLLTWLNEQNTEISDAKAETEERTQELEAARRAAINMMQDADYLRRQAEAAERERTTQAHQLERSNEELQKEITERQRADSRMRAIMKSSLDCIFSMDERGDVLDFNPAAERTFGYSCDDIHAKNLADLIVLPGFREEPRAGVERLLKAGEGPILNKRIEITAIRADGSEFPAEVAIVPSETDRGHIFTGYLRDVSRAKEAEREREGFQRRLNESARQAGMAEVATGVLHNVGNVLNSVNVSANVVTEKLRQSRVVNLAKAAELLGQQDDIGQFLTGDERGRQLPGYLSKLAAHLQTEQQQTLDELGSLTRHIDHVKQIIGTQQSYALVGGTREETTATELLDDALTIHQSSLMQRGVEIVRDYSTAGRMVTDRHRVLQILINLISNAKAALCAADSYDKQLTLTIAGDDEQVRITVADNGIGIPEDHLTKIFAHGFTTKSDGHGFGLHASALAATELGGSLSARSEGLGCGASFTLQLPVQHEAGVPCTA